MHLSKFHGLEGCGIPPIAKYAKDGAPGNRPSAGCLLRADSEQQQCLVVLLHAVPFDFAHDQLP
jgi:hypothetical protein